MNIHKNARLTLRGRGLLVRRIVEEGLRPIEAAQASGVSVRTAYKWLRRFREEGLPGLADRSSRPAHCPHATPAAVQAIIIALVPEHWLIGMSAPPTVPVVVFAMVLSGALLLATVTYFAIEKPFLGLRRRYLA